MMPAGTRLGVATLAAGNTGVAPATTCGPLVSAVSVRSPLGCSSSEGTVKNHLSRILGRLGLRDRARAAIYARDHGLIG